MTHLPRRVCLPILLLFLVSLACQQSSPDTSAPWNASQLGTPVPTAAPTTTVFMPLARRDLTQPIASPTPDPPHELPQLRTEPLDYTVQAGDTLGQIARQYGVSIETIIQANDLANPNFLSVGQVLKIPPPDPSHTGSAFKIIPDAELVYGPTSVLFDTAAFIQKQNGYLAHHEQTVEDLGDATLSGAEIVLRVAQQYSVNPRLLLAVLEYQSGWVTQPNPSEATLDAPIGAPENWRQGLYRQLAWAANQLNRGYYLWRVNGVNSWVLSDGSVVPVAPTINAGTAGVQQLFAMLYARSDWDRAVSAEGVFATYQAFFGYPFDYALEPIVPAGIRQPQLQLPFEPGVVWAFTGGPHGGWGDGSAWAALDFAPSGGGLGCVTSDAWVVAAGDGPIVRAGDGEVIQDLDGGGVASDGLEQTGWVLLYMHIEARDRVRPGTYLHAGERIGHPSCEGGFSNGTHVHLARRYNGEWIPADQKIPFVLDGWISRGSGVEYNGFLERDDDRIEAWDGIRPENSIHR